MEFGKSSSNYLKGKDDCALVVARVNIPQNRDIRNTSELCI